MSTAFLDSIPLSAAERVAAVARVRREVARGADREGILRRDERILLACSGGPDSTALLDACCRLAPPRGWAVQVAHVDHGLRSHSDREADGIAQLCERARIPFHRLAVTVGAGAGIPDRARTSRYEALRTLASRVEADVIVLGHTADDQAETVLMRALSQATPRSLRGMAGRTGDIARPLLRLWRADITAYCAALSLPVIDDPSNRDPRFLRSRIRHEVLPAIERVFPAARRRLVALAEHQRDLLDAPEDHRGDATAGGSTTTP